MLTDDGAPVSATRAGILIGIGMGLSGIGSSSAAVALPSIRTAFDLGDIGTAWVLGAFVIGVAASAPIYGRLADRFGTRYPFAAGLTLFAVGSVLSAIAWDPALLYLGRGLQGAGAGTFPTLGAITISSRFQGQERTDALARVGALAAGAAMGVLLGGLLDAWFGWRAVMALPVVILLIAPSTVRIAPRHHTPAPNDWFAIACVVMLVFGLVLVLQGPTAGPSVVIIGGALLLVSIPLLVRHVFRVPDGLLPRAVVTNPVFLTTAMAGMAVPGLYYAGLVLVPTGLVNAYGWGPIAVGAALLPPSIAGVVLPRLAVRIPMPRSWLAPLALAFGGLGLLLGAVATDNGWALVLAFGAACTAFGIAQGALVDRISTHVHGPRGATIGSYTLVFFLGGAISSGLCGLLAATWSPTVAFAVLGVIFIAAGVMLRLTWHQPDRIAARRAQTVTAPLL